LTFQMNTVPSSSGTSRCLEMKVLYCLDYPVTQHNILEEWSPYSLSIFPFGKCSSFVGGRLYLCLFISASFSVYLT
jgi:hypothetical protein